MATDANRQDVIDLAIELIEEMSTELDGYYEDPELAEMGPAIETLQKLQSLTGREPEDVFVHIVDRFTKARAEAAARGED